MLPTNKAISRLGVAYVRKVCAHAHVGFTEESADEDHLAVDGAIRTRGASTPVQIKATTTKSIKKVAGTFKVDVDPDWVEKWRQNINPTYLILVLLAKKSSSWVVYDPTATTVPGFAIWERVDTLAEGTTSLTMDRAQRFTPLTINDWTEILQAGYGPVSA
ncbi:DUF4365 domain-containing protein [Nocardioides montaniterrae]